jgi:hypothetical protein
MEGNGEPFQQEQRLFYSCCGNEASHLRVGREGETEVGEGVIDVGIDAESAEEGRGRRR